MVFLAGYIHGQVTSALQALHGVSFSILLGVGCVMQAAGALDKYAVNAVVANLLHTRKDRVLIVKQQQQLKQQEQQQQQQSHQVVEVLRAKEEPHIEKQLVAEIVQLHKDFQQQRTQQQ